MDMTTVEREEEQAGKALTESKGKSSGRVLKKGDELEEERVWRGQWCER